MQWHRAMTSWHSAGVYTAQTRNRPIVNLSWSQSTSFAPYAASLVWSCSTPKLRMFKQHPGVRQCTIWVFFFYIGSTFVWTFCVFGTVLENSKTFLVAEDITQYGNNFGDDPWLFLCLSVFPAFRCVALWNAHQGDSVNNLCAKNIPKKRGVKKDWMRIMESESIKIAHILSALL